MEFHSQVLRNVVSSTYVKRLCSLQFVIAVGTVLVLYTFNRKVSFMEVDQRSVLAAQEIEFGRVYLECSVAMVNFPLPVA